METMSDCQHQSFDSFVGIHRLTDANGLLTDFHADIRVTCHECKQKFVWLGVPTVGMSLDGPTVSMDGEELRCPIAPSFAWSGPGEPLAARGFSVRKVAP